MLSERTKLGLRVLQAALLLGLVGDALLRDATWGLNFFLWVLALVAAVVALDQRKRLGLRGDGGWLLPAAVVMSACLVWRDSLTLRLLDIASVLLLLGLVARRAWGRSVRLAGVLEYARDLIAAFLNTVFGMFPLALRDVAWKEIPLKGRARHLWAIVRGMAIALPLVFIFGALLTAADAVFEGIVRSVFRFDVDMVAGHIVFIAFLTWVSSGFLRAVVLGGDVTAFAAKLTAFAAKLITAQTTGANAGSTTTEATVTGQAGDGARTTSVRTFPLLPFRVGIVEVGIVLGLLDLLFSVFVAVQLRYLFGGASHVVTSAGLTYAEYARRGFFELAWVSALVLPLLLALHWFVRHDDEAHKRIFRALAGVQLVLLFVIMTSALKRMYLYQSQYGLTELRLYTTAFMGWLAIVFVWFALTVLRGRRERFICGAVVAGLVIVVSLHALNPDGLIVRTNVARAEAGHAFDADYVASLSDAAVPALVEAMPRLSDEGRRAVASRIVKRWLTPGADSHRTRDWRSWNSSRAAAQRAVKADADALLKAALP